MNSNKIAEKFSKGQACAFWLTPKQTDWLLNVAHQESGENTHFGRRSGKGEFKNESGLYRWECSEGYNKTSFLKVFKVEDKSVEENPFKSFVESKGHNFMDVALHNPQLMAELAKEWGEKCHSN